MFSVTACQKALGRTGADPNAAAVWLQLVESGAKLLYYSTILRFDYTFTLLHHRRRAAQLV